MIIYSMDGEDGRPEEVKGQYTIYEARPSDPGYSPLWRHNYIIVPRDFDLGRFVRRRMS